MIFGKNAIGLRAVAATAVVGALLAFSAPSFADDTAAPAASTATTQSSAQHVDRVEAWINSLHQQLQITAAQETLWTAVAQTMRDNAKTIGDMAKERRSKAATMTAVDDLKNYEAIADAQAEGLKKLIPAFEALYNSMSDDQKKIADKLFQHAHRMGHQRKG